MVIFVNKNGDFNELFRFRYFHECMRRQKKQYNQPVSVKDTSLLLTLLVIGFNLVNAIVNEYC